MLVETLAQLNSEGLAVDLDVAGSGPVSCRSFIPHLSYQYSSLACLTYNYIDSVATL